MVFDPTVVHIANPVNTPFYALLDGRFDFIFTFDLYS